MNHTTYKILASLFILDTESMWVYYSRAYNQDDNEIEFKLLYPN